MIIGSSPRPAALDASVTRAAAASDRVAGSIGRLPDRASRAASGRSRGIPVAAATSAAAATAALAAAGGNWVFIDNLDGGWINSAGVSTLGAQGTGPWQTGTGWVGDPKGDGNGDLYLGDNTHPNEAGCQYLATRIATDLRAAILAL